MTIFKKKRSAPALPEPEPAAEPAAATTTTGAPPVVTLVRVEFKGPPHVRDQVAKALSPASLATVGDFFAALSRNGFRGEVVVEVGESVTRLEG